MFHYSFKFSHLISLGDSVLFEIMLYDPVTAGKPSITQTCPCNILQYFGEAVLTSTHNLCFGAKIRKICIPE